MECSPFNKLDKWFMVGPTTRAPMTYEHCLNSFIQTNVRMSDLLGDYTGLAALVVQCYYRLDVKIT